MQLLSGTTGREGPEGCAQDLLEALPPVMRFLRKHMRCRRDRTISVPQFRTLALLGSAPSVNLSAVADTLDASLPTASRIVSGLVARGWVVRHECASDRRHVELSLTARGQQNLEMARAGAKEYLVQELSRLDAAEVRTISKAMGLLHSVFAQGLQAGDGEKPCRGGGRKASSASAAATAGAAAGKGVRARAEVK
jgi:DNA-binding MarR family transcriptional regulator